MIIAQWIIVGLVLAYVLWQILSAIFSRRKKGKGGCNCGCCDLKDKCNKK